MRFNYKEDFKDPILDVLSEQGGKAKLKDIYNLVWSKYGEYLGDPYWHEKVDKDLRWRDYINRCRYDVLIPAGLIRKDSKHGTWELK